jgi:hypothetical protein
LVAEFFERDLSEEELGTLRESLASEEAALRFSDKARLFQQSLGVAATVALMVKLAGSSAAKGAGATASFSFFGTGSTLVGKAVVAKAMAVALGAALFVGASAVAYKALRAPVVAFVTPVQVAAPVLEVAAPSSGARPKRRAPALALVQPAAQHGKQLVIRLNLEEAVSVETIVRDAQGALVCSLGTLALNAGVHRLVWNGRASDGSALAAGRYQVVTRWNGKEIVRWVELQPPSLD